MSKPKFIPFPINIIDVTEVFNAVMLVITGNNIGHLDPTLTIISLSLFAAGKKVVEIGRAKTSITPTPDPQGKPDPQPVDER